MEHELEKSEARKLLEKAGWEYMLPVNAEPVEGSPTDYELSATVSPTVEVGSSGVQKAYKVSVRSGQYSNMKVFPVETEVGNYLETRQNVNENQQRDWMLDDDVSGPVQFIEKPDDGRFANLISELEDDFPDINVDHGDIAVVRSVSSGPVQGQLEYAIGVVGNGPHQNMRLKGEVRRGEPGYTELNEVVS